MSGDGGWCSRTALALFDLDGCLVDSTRAITGALVEAFAELGVPGLRPKDLTWCVGPPLLGSVTRILTDAGADLALAPAVVDGYRARYKVTSLDETEVIDGMPQVLEELQAARIRLAVVTSKPGPFARPLIDGLGLGGWFEAVHSPDTDELTEPKAVTLQRALAELAPGGDPASAAMIGDRSHDIDAGHACGTRTVGVTWGAGSIEELRDARAHHIVERPLDLPALLVT